MNIVSIIQARMASSRLPGKVLLDIAGQPMLVRVVERVRQAKTVGQVVVATTVDTVDDPVAALCTERGYPFYRGSANDVLDRYYQAGRTYQADVIVRITADCPLIDPQLVDYTVNVFLGREACPHAQISHPIAGEGHGMDPSYTFDFAADRLPPPWKRTYPIGLDTEVCSMAALERAWKEAHETYQREHVMPYLYDDVGVGFDQPSRFRVILLHNPEDYGSYRWTVDTAEDLQVVRHIFTHFNGREDFSWREVLALYVSDPELKRINAGIRHKTLTEVDTRSPDAPTR